MVDFVEPKQAKWVCHLLWETLKNPYWNLFCRLKHYFQNFLLHANQQFDHKRKVILKQNLDVLVPKYMGTISFVFHFLEQYRELV